MIKKSGAAFKKSLSKLKRAFFGIINIRYWFDWDRVKAGTLYLKNGIVRLFTTDKEGQPEFFNDAARKFNLSEEELVIKQNSLLRLSILMICLSVIIFAYIIYQLFFGTYHAALISLVVMGIALVLAFRYHFWYFQIKNRKLGCTFQEWYQALRGGKK